MNDPSAPASPAADPPAAGPAAQAPTAADLPAAGPAAQDPTAPYAGFGGKVGTIFSTSEPHWTPPPRAPAGAPNVVIVLADDLGYSDLGCYGSEIATPELDRLAAEGVRYTDFHVNPMCSPTRASLMTGLNAHMAGVGHIVHSDPGFPGYAHELRDNAVTMAEVFRDHGWATLMAGKWHLTKDAHLSDAAPKYSWPLQRGFDRFYGILDAFTNYHQPHRLCRDNHHVSVDRYPDGYYFTDDLTDQATAMIDELRASHPAKPFFLYFAHGAPHAPLQAKPADMGAYRGRYAAGWDRIRAERFERQRELGVVEPGTVLPPRNSEAGHEVGPWDDCSAVERELFARYMEIYAGMVDNIDQNFGKLRRHLEAMGEWDNTIVVFTSDNGGSREGHYTGTSAYFRTLLAHVRRTDMESVEVDHARLDLLGGPQTLAHYPMGWAMVSCTPFRLYKINTHRGGHSVPFIVSWPARLGVGGAVGGGSASGVGAAGNGDGAAGALRRQYQHVTDVLPTLAELAGVTIPTARGGVPVPAPAGASFAPSLTDGAAASTHPRQYYEMTGHRGIYSDGWSAVTCHAPRTPFSQDRWELHDLAADPTECRDLAAANPERLAELEEAWTEAAWANQVFPIDEGNLLKMVLRPPWAAEVAAPVKLRPGLPTLERWRSQQLIFQKSFDVEIELDWRPGDEGMLVAHGDQGGGYAVYIEDGRLLHAHNAYGEMTVMDCGPLAEGLDRITLAVENPGNMVWNVRLSAGGATAGEAPGLVGFMAMAPFEGIDIGIDRRSPVSWDLYERRGPFPYTGSLTAVTYHPGAPAPDAAELFIDYLREAGTRYE